jgi:hypothetical protein
MNEPHYLDPAQRELLEGLRALAAEGPSEAPRQVEEQLKAEFRRHHRRRTLMAWMPAFSLAAAAGIALAVWIHNENPKPAPVPPLAANAVAPAMEEEADASFYPLPEAEALPMLETAMVVRVQMPVSSLQLMGVPVGEERTESSVQAELLLGQDGLARGVRLVQ